ncbi:MAG: hypothetical protein AAF800_11200 [Planctomycetota bacterium]
MEQPQAPRNVAVILAVADGGDVASTTGPNMRYRTGFDRLRRVPRDERIGRRYPFRHHRSGDDPVVSIKITRHN